MALFPVSKALINYTAPNQRFINLKVLQLNRAIQIFIKMTFKRTFQSLKVTFVKMTLSVGNVLVKFLFLHSEL